MQPNTVSGREPKPMNRDNERGIAAMWTAMMLVILVASAGMAVDVGAWKLAASRQQNAADAGALGGVVLLPGAITDGKAVAFEIANQHGYDPSEVTVRQGAQPNQLEVTVQRTVQTSFLSVVGVDTQTITQTATAEFEPPLSLGSPEPTAGNDPEANPLNQPQYWINSAGPNAYKINGDRYATQLCNGATHNCDSSDVNLDYDPNGYFFGITVSPAALGRSLSIQVYDGQTYASGDHCENGNQPDLDQRNILQTLTATDPVPAGLVKDQYADAPSRYVDGDSKWCVGDVPINGTDVVTQLVFRVPDETPWNNLDNNVVGTCAAETLPNFDPSLSVFDLLFPDGEPLPGETTPYVEADPATSGEHVISATDNKITFAETYRRWYTACTIPANELVAGEYIVQMVTPSGGGHNRLSIRAGSVTGPFNGAGVSVHAKGRLPIFANAPAANTVFSIARVLPGGRNRELIVELFDMGDAASPGTLEVLPPVESLLATFSNCKFSRSDGVDLTTGSGCIITGVSSGAGFNGRSIVVSIPILESAYSCDAASATGCWVRVRANFPDGVSDTTTWSATMNGDPVRLIK